MLINVSSSPATLRGFRPLTQHQVGYPLNAPKRAIVSAWLGSLTAVAPILHATLRLPAGDASPFSVVDAVSGAVVFTGTAQRFGDGVIHEYFKQVAFHLDFSALTAPVSWVELVAVQETGEQAALHKVTFLDGSLAFSDDMAAIFSLLQDAVFKHDMKPFLPPRRCCACHHNRAATKSRCQGWVSPTPLQCLKTR